MCDLFSDSLGEIDCTAAGDADDHDVGVVVVVDTLQGLVEFENRVEGLLIELTDVLNASGRLVNGAARACNSGIN